MIKFRWYYDIDLEEKFLNEMSRKGYYLKKFIIGFYKFDKIDSTDYTYRVDLINDRENSELKEYIDLIEQSGAKKMFLLLGIAELLISVG